MLAFASSMIRKLGFSSDRAIENASFQEFELLTIRLFNDSKTRKCDLSRARAFENLIFSITRARENASFQKVDHSKARVFKRPSDRKCELSEARTFEVSTFQ